MFLAGLSSKQKEVYRNVLLRDIDMVNGTRGGGSSAGRTVILNIVMQLRKCCNHPYLFAGVEDRKLDPLGDHLILNCGKVTLVFCLLSLFSVASLYTRELPHATLWYTPATNGILPLETTSIYVPVRFVTVA